MYKDIKDDQPKNVAKSEREMQMTHLGRVNWLSISYSSM